MSLNSLNQRIPLRTSRYTDSLYHFLNPGPTTRSYCLACCLKISRPSKPRNRRIRSSSRSCIPAGQRKFTASSFSQSNESPETKSQRKVESNINTEDTSATDSSHEPRPSETLVKSALVRRREKRANYEEHKRNRKVDPEDYNSPMRVNPWAMILSSAPRLCSLTRARLPEKLMTGFSLVQHPETSALWLLPTSLQKKQLQKSNNDTTSTHSSKHEEGEEEGAPALESETDNGGSEKGHPPRHKIPEMRILNSKMFLDKLSEPKTQGIIKGAIPTRWKDNIGTTKKSIKTALKNVVWREDMGDHLLLQMRGKAVKTLKNIIGRQDSSVYERDALKVLDGLDSTTAAAAVSTKAALEDGLRELGDVTDMGKGVILINNTKCAEPQAVPDLVKLPIQKTEVPVFNMGKLFSKADLEELENHHPILKEKALFLVAGRKKSAKVVVALWTLKLYLGDA